MKRARKIKNEIHHSKVSTNKMLKITKPRDETLLAIRELTSNARVLLDILYSLHTDWEFKDEVMADMANVKVRTYKLMVKELKEKGYLYIAKGPEVDNYYIGKDAVKKFLESKSKRGEIND